MTGGRPIPTALAIGLALTGVVVVAALVSLVWTPHPPDAVRILQRLRPPGPEHWLGTDHFGRDTFSMLLVGARHSLMIAAASVALGLGIGVPLGLLAAARPGWTDEAVARASDLLFAFPAVLTAIVLAASLGPGAGNAVIAIGVFSAAVLARVTRNAARAVWRRDFVRAALALGRGPWAATWTHVLPNAAGVIAVQATALFAVAILAEAALGYLGLGLQPPAPSWGRMLNDAQTFLYVAPMQAVWPGLAVAVTVLGINLLGDGLRDRLDPRHGAGGVG